MREIEAEAEIETNIEVRTETEIVWNDFHERLRGFISRRVSNPDDAEDILQDVFLRIHDRLNTLKDSARINAWLFQIARNAIIDHYRAGARGRGLLEKQMKELGIAAANESEKSAVFDPSERDRKSVHAELSSCVAPLARLLPPEYREAIELVEIGGEGTATAAEKLGLSASGMKSRVQRGRRKLKDIFERCCRVDRNRHGVITDFESRNDFCSDDSSC